MSRIVDCASGVPAWQSVAAVLREQGHAVQMRMIDGQLAFPDEEPPADWRELRVSLGGAMVTVRRQESAVELMTWGNADETQRSAWEAVAGAFEVVSSRH